MFANRRTCAPFESASVSKHLNDVITEVDSNAAHDDRQERPSSDELSNPLQIHDRPRAAIHPDKLLVEELAEGGAHSFAAALDQIRHLLLRALGFNSASRQRHSTATLSGNSRLCLSTRMI